jgi:Tfp pilus assembly protein PilZ
MAPVHEGDSDSSSISSIDESAARSGSTPHHERRKGDRQAHRLSVKILTTPAGYAASYVGLTENLSEGGAFVATRAPWSIGCTIDLIIGLPHQGIVRARGTVCWRRSGSLDGDQAPGIGVRFERLPSDVVNRIRAIAKA